MRLEPFLFIMVIGKVFYFDLLKYLEMLKKHV
jgi:hypothetical protein